MSAVRSSVLKRIAKAVLRRAAPAIYAERPIATWPAWIERVYDIRIPRATIPQPELAPTGGANINIIFRMIDRTRLLPGEIAECGVYRGASLLAMGIYLRHNGIGKRIYGFDSFKGFDESINIDLELHGADNEDKVPRGFSDTSIQLVLENARI